MPTIPSTKGSVLAEIVEHLLELVSAGQISRDELERRLEPDDLALLYGSVQVAEWYDVRIFTRLMLALRDLGGRGDDDFVRRHGARTAERLLKAGLYQQLEYLNRTQLQDARSSQERFLAFGRDLRLLTTLGATLHNHSRWQTKPDPTCTDRYVIEVSEAGAFPDVFVYFAEGFMNQMAKEHGEPDLWRGERPQPELILYRMVRPL